MHHGGKRRSPTEDNRRPPFRPAPKSAPKDERTIYDFIQELYKTRRVSDRTYKRVQSLLGDAATVELVGILGYYALISMTLNVFRMLPPETEKLAFPRIARCGRFNPTALCVLMMTLPFGNCLRTRTVRHSA